MKTYKINNGIAALMVCVMIGIIVTFLSGCSADNAYSDPISMSILISHRANMERVPVTAEQVADRLYDTVFTYGDISLINCDGDPSPVFQTSIPDPGISGLSKSKLQSIADVYVRQLQEEMNAICAKRPEVDLLGAIRIAAQQLHNAPGEHVMLILDSGISTKSYIDMTTGIFYADPEAVVEWLKKEHALPDLQGIHVEWYMPATASPQEPLSEDQKYRIRELWAAVLEASGAKSISISEVTYGTDAPEGMPKVSCVDVAEPSEQPDILETVMLDESKVRFQGDCAEFADSEKATETLRETAALLLEHPENRVFVAGTTATSIIGDRDYCKKLSAARAKKVCDILFAYGVPEEQLIPIGLGYEDDPWHVNDVKGGTYIT